MIQLTIYTKAACPNCDIVKQHCMIRGIAYTEVTLGTPEDIEKFKAEYPNVRAVPYVLGPSGVIGGFTAFKTWLRTV